MKPAIRQLLFGSQFNLSRLFLDGSQGFWFDPTDASTAYQDSAGTTAGVVGQPLGKRVDKSGRGNNAAQITAASRPLWTQDGSGYFRDTFDGFDDALTISGGGGSTTGFFYCAAIHVAGGAGTNRRLLSDSNGSTTGYMASLNTGNAFQLAVGNGVGFTIAAGTAGAIAVGSAYVVTAWHDGVNVSVQVGRDAIASTPMGAVTAGTSTMTEGSNNGGAVNFFNGSLYTRIYRAGPPPSASQIAQIQRYVAARAGVAL